MNHSFFHHFTAFALTSLFFLSAGQVKGQQSAGSLARPVGGEFSIEGVADSLPDGSKIILGKTEGLFRIIPMDTAEVTGGRFSFKGHIQAPIIRTLSYFNTQTRDYRSIGILLQPRDFKVNLAKNEKQRSVEGAGNDGNAWLDYEQLKRKLNEPTIPDFKIVYIDSTATAEQKRQAAARMKAANLKRDSLLANYIIERVPSAFSTAMLEANFTQLPETDVKRILQVMAVKTPDDPNYLKVDKYFKDRSATTLGATFTDLQFASPDGKLIKLSDYVRRNKIVMVDFWASWCAPCRAEMPNVKKAYDAFHKKGFEVVGVSLDNKKEAWVNALKTLGLPWPQMSDLKGWKSEACKKYFVNAIPATFLIDSNGKIIDKNLRGLDLYNRLEQLLK